MYAPAELPGNPRPVADQLRHLLAEPGRYQAQWMRKAHRTRPGEINDSAVARVVAEYLVASGQLNIDATGHRPLKDKVFRALRGQTITSHTLSLFINAFQMDEQDAQRLWSLFTGTSEASVISGTLRPPSAFPRPNFQTLMLIDFHDIGADKRPLQHRTIQVIRAAEDGLDRYPYRYDTTAASVEVIAGGTASSMRKVDNDLFVTDILLPRPLSQGDTATLEYRTTFRYGTAPRPEFRRVATKRIENLSISVKFDAATIPSKVWWGVWADYRDSSPMLVREEVALAPDGSINRHVDALEHTVAGFCWEW